MPVFHPVAQRLDRADVGQRFQRHVRCRAKTRDSDQVFGAAAVALFLAAAAHQRRGHQDLAGTHKRAGSLGSADLVAGEDQEIGAEVAERQRQPSGALHRIDHQKPLPGLDDVGRSAHRLDHAGLVVGELQGEHRLPGRRIVRGKSGFKRCQIKPAFAIDRQHGDLLRRKPAAGENGGMLDSANIQMRDMNCCTAHAEIRRQHMIGGLGGAGDKGHLGGRNLAKPGHCLTRPSNHAARAPAFGMHRGRVAGKLHRVKHCRPRFGKKRRRCIVIEIEALRRHGGFYP